MKQKHHVANPPVTTSRVKNQGEQETPTMPKYVS